MLFTSATNLNPIKPRTNGLFVFARLLVNLRKPLLGIDSNSHTSNNAHNRLRSMFDERSLSKFSRNFVGFCEHRNLTKSLEFPKDRSFDVQNASNIIIRWFVDSVVSRNGPRALKMISIDVTTLNHCNNRRQGCYATFPKTFQKTCLASCVCVSVG